jgi:excisionase family DNA binding protein
MLTPAEAADELGVTESRMRQLLGEGRIRGAYQVPPRPGGRWQIPRGFRVQEVPMGRPPNRKR